MEYGLIAALIAIVIIVALTLAGEALQNIFYSVAGGLDTEVPTEAGECENRVFDPADGGGGDNGGESGDEGGDDDPED